MATTPGRIAATVLLALSIVSVGLSIAIPWWGVGREVAGTRSWERYGPFHRDARAEAGAFEDETSTLGVLVAVGGSVLFVSALLHLLHAIDPRRTFGPAAAVTVVGVLALVAAALYVVFAFPAEATRVEGVGLGFVDRDCGTAFGVRFCYLTRPDAGWYLGAGSALLGILGLSAGVLGRPDVEIAGRPRTAEPSGLPASRPSVPPTAPAGASPRVTKCPQCQTKLGGAAQGMVTCHNCGLRFPG